MNYCKTWPNNPLKHIFLFSIFIDYLPCVGLVDKFILFPDNRSRQILYTGDYWLYWISPVCRLFAFNSLPIRFTRSRGLPKYFISSFPIKSYFYLKLPWAQKFECCIVFSQYNIPYDLQCNISPHKIHCISMWSFHCKQIFHRM